MKRLIAIDANLIALVQEGYLWLWDRTGATVGMCIFTLTMYLWCVQVRDREPPQKHVFARGAA